MTIARSSLSAWPGPDAGGRCGRTKGFEYQQKLCAGHGPESDDFWMFYYLLTGFHFMHVAAAVLIVAAVACLVPHRPWGPADTQTPETAAVFWHMGDLLWGVLFPLVYVLR